MDKELKKRLIGGLWVTFAGFMATAIGLFLQHIDAFSLNQTEKTLYLIIGTAIVSQITKYLNSRPAVDTTK